ncbi:hypothetical protein Fot_27706 [Forsythia ovata]|uniref:Uncharacterized protein n=1 Tax=Forsythia ovata TaxID=205694 RepID=A0ABD1TLY3_9LAMI
MDMQKRNTILTQGRSPKRILAEQEKLQDNCEMGPFFLLPAIEEPPEQTRRNRGKPEQTQTPEQRGPLGRRQRRVNRWRCPTTEAPQSPEHRRPLGRRQSETETQEQRGPGATAASQSVAKTATEAASMVGRRHM